MELPAIQDPQQTKPCLNFGPSIARSLGVVRKGTFVYQYATLVRPEGEACRS